MRSALCRHCGNGNLKHKEIEIRHINSKTMKVQNFQTVVELECQVCGWIGTTEEGPSNLSLIML